MSQVKCLFHIIDVLGFSIGFHVTRFGFYSVWFENQTKPNQTGLPDSESETKPSKMDLLGLVLLLGLLLGFTDTTAWSTELSHNFSDSAWLSVREVVTCKCGNFRACGARLKVYSRPDDHHKGKL